AQPTTPGQEDSPSPGGGASTAMDTSSAAPNDTALKEDAPSGSAGTPVEATGTPGVGAGVATSEANPTVATAGSASSGTSSPTRDEFAVVASNSQAANCKASNGNGSTVTLSLGKANVAFKI